MGIKDITWDKMIYTTKGDLQSDPLSGSILKVLSDNGFRNRIENGFLNGHHYTILRAPQSPEFTLVDTWTEHAPDESGIDIPHLRKTYQFFKITSPISSDNSSQDKGDSAPVTLPAENQLNNSVPDSRPVTENVPIVRPEELASSSQKVSPETVLSTPHIEEAPIPEATSPMLEIPTIIPDQVPQKSESSQMVSSYDLLKKKLQTNPPVTVPRSIDLFRNKKSQAELKDQRTPQQQFIDTFFKENPTEWASVEKIPVRPFIYPQEYAWGSDAAGNQIFHTLADYPEHARKFREGIINSVEALSAQGIDIEHITVGDFIQKAFEKKLLP